MFNLPCLVYEQGEGMFTMAMIGKVKRMFFRENKSVREIVRLTSVSCAPCVRNAGVSHAGLQP